MWFNLSCVVILAPWPKPSISWSFIWRHLISWQTAASIPTVDWWAGQIGRKRCKNTAISTAQKVTFLRDCDKSSTGPRYHNIWATHAGRECGWGREKKRAKGAHRALTFKVFFFLLRLLLSAYGAMLKPKVNLMISIGKGFIMAVAIDKYTSKEQQKTKTFEKLKKLKIIDRCPKYMVIIKCYSIVDCNFLVFTKIIPIKVTLQTECPVCA